MDERLVDAAFARAGLSLNITKLPMAQKAMKAANDSMAMTRQAGPMEGSANVFWSSPAGSEVHWSSHGLPNLRDRSIAW